MHRIGLIVPSSNTTMETEIPSLLHGRAGMRVVEDEPRAVRRLCEAW